MEEWEEALRELRIQFVRESLDRVREMDRTVTLLEQDAADAGALADLLRRFHAFAGSGSTYGFPVVSDVCLRAERRCADLVRRSAAPDAADLVEWHEAVRAVAGELRAAEDPPAAPGGDTKPDAAPASRRVFDILIAEPDVSLREQFSRFAEIEGMTVRAAATKAEAIAAIEGRRPDGVVTSIRLGTDSGYALVEHLRSRPDGETIPILVTSPMAAFLDKVEAIHCGADGYFEEPIDWDALMRRLQHLLDRGQAHAARVLAVEDDAYQGAFLRAVLQSAGYEVRVCEDPRHFESELLSFDPDLVLMDIMLPGVSGYDLARYLRQDERHATLPVVFLTTESQMQARIESARAGGDEHLVKPVAPSLLLSTVAARVERARFLKSLLERDGLTRLLTHTAFLERARAVLSRKDRDRVRTCAWVMIDIDHFKAVNDAHGHPVGDRVLSSLSALLRRRLRQSDTIGRYGGEEFGVLLEDLQQPDAVRLVTRLLEEFSQMPHQAPGGQEFRCTFSAGVAMLAPNASLETWRQAADDALYRAKEAGRERVVTA